MTSCHGFFCKRVNDRSKSRLIMVTLAALCVVSQMLFSTAYSSESPNAALPAWERFLNVNPIMEKMLLPTFIAGSDSKRKLRPGDQPYSDDTVMDVSSSLDDNTALNGHKLRTGHHNFPFIHDIGATLENQLANPLVVIDSTMFCRWPGNNCQSHPSEHWLLISNEMSHCRTIYSTSHLVWSMIVDLDCAGVAAPAWGKESSFSLFRNCDDSSFIDATCEWLPATSHSQAVKPAEKSNRLSCRIEYDKDGHLGLDSDNLGMCYFVDGHCLSKDLEEHRVFCTGWDGSAKNFENGTATPSPGQNVSLCIGKHTETGHSCSSCDTFFDENSNTVKDGCRHGRYVRGLYGPACYSNANLESPCFTYSNDATAINFFSESINCVGEWSEWSSCSAFDADGTYPSIEDVWSMQKDSKGNWPSCYRTKRYEVKWPAENRGKPCEYRDGSMWFQSCPDDTCQGQINEGVLENKPLPCSGKWGNWSRCNTDCYRNRSFVVMRPHSLGGALCDWEHGQKEVMSCNPGEDECPRYTSIEANARVNYLEKLKNDFDSHYNGSALGETCTMKEEPWSPCDSLCRQYQTISFVDSETHKTCKNTNRTLNMRSCSSMECSSYDPFYMAVRLDAPFEQLIQNEDQFLRSFVAALSDITNIDAAYIHADYISKGSTIVHMFISPPPVLSASGYIFDSIERLKNTPLRINALEKSFLVEDVALTSQFTPRVDPDKLSFSRGINTAFVVACIISPIVFLILLISLICMCKKCRTVKSDQLKLIANTLDAEEMKPTIMGRASETSLSTEVPADTPIASPTSSCIRQQEVTITIGQTSGEVDSVSGTLISSSGEEGPNISQEIELPVVDSMTVSPTTDSNSTSGNPNATSYGTGLTHKAKFSQKLQTKLTGSSTYSNFQ